MTLRFDDQADVRQQPPVVVASVGLVVEPQRHGFALELVGQERRGVLALVVETLRAEVVVRHPLPVGRSVRPVGLRRVDAEQPHRVRRAVLVADVDRVAVHDVRHRDRLVAGHVGGGASEAAAGCGDCQKQ